MPTLHWIGKEKVINHHHDVPFRLLKKEYAFQAKEGTPQNSTGNRIIHGDNLEALKSLLPEFEGRINCIYIDPPYNTGNEGWVYNDNVNDPKIKKWLGEVVGKEGEDLSRHDKWLCMMYPRLKLLHRLLAEDGVIFISIDDNEQAHLKMLINDIFGEKNFIGEIIWKNVTDNNPTNISIEHEYIFCSSKNRKSINSIWKSNVSLAQKILLEKEKELLLKFHDLDALKQAYTEWFKENKLFLGELDRYKHIDFGGIYIGSQSVHNPGKEGYRYDVIHPETNLPCKQPLMGYRFPYETMQQLLQENKILFGDDENKIIELKLYVKEYKSKLSSYFELDSRVGTNDVKTIFHNNSRPFDYPKPTLLLEELLSFSAKKNSIILDSFAGSGTTAHAVLKLNAEDGGNRRFICVEMMDYAETITAERVRRVMNGYGEGKKAVGGLGGGFDYYTVDAPLFIDGHNLNEEVGAEAIRHYVAYTEGIPSQAQLTQDNTISPYALGVHNDALYVFYYERERITTLGVEFLNTLNLTELKPRPSGYIVYADKCAVNDEFLLQHGIVFKRIPRDISRL